LKYAVVRARDVERDLAAIFEFLIESYQAFGEDADTAIDRAAKRIRRIENAMESIGKVPHQGTLLPQLMPGLRSATKDSAIFYFEVDDERRTVKILAVLFGAQDHRRRMLRRLLTRQ